MNHAVFGLGLYISALAVGFVVKAYALYLSNDRS
jgi:hypothetical protein